MQRRGVIRLNGQDRLKQRDSLDMLPFLHQPLRISDTIGDGGSSLNEIPQLVKRIIALTESVDSRSGPAQRAQLDGEEVGPGSDRLEKEDQPVPVDFGTAMVRIDH